MGLFKINQIRWVVTAAMLIIKFRKHMIIRNKHLSAETKTHNMSQVLKKRII